MKNALAMVLLATAAHAQIPVNLPAARPAEPAAAPTPGGGRGAAQAPAGAAGRGRGAAAPSAAAPSPKDLKYPSLRALHTPATIAFTLPNGMKVVLLEDRDLPVTGGVALVRAGTLTDPPERIGMAHLASILLRTGGTTVKTGEQVDNLLDGGAASLDSQAGESAATLAFSSLTENTAAALELFREVLVQPGFRPDRVEMARAQMRDAIAHRNDNPAVVARREFGALVYGAVHSGQSFLPPADPWWARIIPITLVGILWGWAFIRWDALTVVLSHWACDLFLFNRTRILSDDPWTRLSAVGCIALPLLPAAAAIGWRIWERMRRQVDPEPWEEDSDFSGYDPGTDPGVPESQVDDKAAGPA